MSMFKKFIVCQKLSDGCVFDFFKKTVLAFYSALLAGI